MKIVAQEKKNSKRYLPHPVSTKEGAVKLYRQTKEIDFILRRYHIGLFDIPTEQELLKAVEELQNHKELKEKSAYKKGATPYY